MSGLKMKHVFVLFMVLAVVGFVGCILNPDVVAPKPHPISNYKDLTHKEDVVANLVQSYKDHNIEPLKELLHLEYIWYNQAADVQNGAPEFNTRDQDIAMNTRMFLAVNHDSSVDPAKWVDRLDLSITSAPWTQITVLEGNPCEDCWQSTREYYITLEFAGGTTTLLGNDLVTFTVVPVTKDGIKHYYLRRADDLKKP